MRLPRSRKNRFVCGARIAILAILIQTLIPFLVAAEIRAANAGELPICSAASELGNSGNSAPAGDHHPSGACPICLALHASLAFAAPLATPVPVPGQAISILQVRPEPRPAAAAPAAAYRSRAPPLT